MYVEVCLPVLSPLMCIADDDPIDIIAVYSDPPTLVAHSMNPSCHVKEGRPLLQNGVELGLPILHHAIFTEFDPWL